MKLFIVLNLFIAMIIATVIAEAKIDNKYNSITNSPLVNDDDDDKNINKAYNIKLRYRKSPKSQPQGSIVLQGQKPMSGPERRPTWNLDYQHNIWKGKDGQVSASGGALKLPGQKVQPQIGIQGQWRFR